MAAHFTYTAVLDDAALKTHLQNQDTLSFVGLNRKSWLHIEKQVERLGFGNTYIVSLRASTSRAVRITLRPG